MFLLDNLGWLLQAQTTHQALRLPESQWPCEMSQKHLSQGRNETDKELWDCQRKTQNISDACFEMRVVLTHWKWEASFVSLDDSSHSGTWCLILEAGFQCIFTISFKVVPVRPLKANTVPKTTAHEASKLLWPRSMYDKGAPFLEEYP